MVSEAEIMAKKSKNSTSLFAGDLAPHPSVKNCGLLDQTTYLSEQPLVLRWGGCHSFQQRGLFLYLRNNVHPRFCILSYSNHMEERIKWQWHVWAWVWALVLKVPSMGRGEDGNGRESHACACGLVPDHPFPGVPVHQTTATPAPGGGGSGEWAKWGESAPNGTPSRGRQAWPCWPRWMSPVAVLLCFCFKAQGIPGIFAHGTCSSSSWSWGRGTSTDSSFQPSFPQGLMLQGSATGRLLSSRSKSRYMYAYVRVKDRTSL